MKKYYQIQRNGKSANIPCDEKVDGTYQREEREEGAAYSCPFSGEGRFVYIGKLLKVQRIPEAYSLDLKLKDTVCIMRFLNSVFSGINST